MKPNQHSSESEAPKTTRREFLTRAGGAVVGGALAGVSLPHVHAGEDGTIRLALIGSGGRGSGAVGNAIEASGGPVKLVAMADLFPEKLDRSLRALSKHYPESVDVPPERQFLGFDAYKRAMDCLRPGDVALLTTHAAYRATHLEQAVSKGLNVFMEKSFAPDPGGIRRILKLGEAAGKKNLKIATGLMCRHSAARQAFIERLRDGALGEITLQRAYRMDSGSRMKPRPADTNELLWQISHPYFFFWVSTGRFIDYMIHQVDECCWIKDAWPVSAHGLGGREPGAIDCSQNHHAYAIEYTFADGSKAFVNNRSIPKCHSDFATFVHGTKAAGQFSGNVHAPAGFIYKDQRTTRDNVAWRPEKETQSPYVAEWSALLHAIRSDLPHNEAKRSAYSNLAAIMGRAAVHSGQIITWDDAMASDFRFCDHVDDLVEDSPAPVQADEQGRYPVPVPGKWTEV